MSRGEARPGVVVVIPASLASKRLPGKMLLAETGRPVILHTWDRASRAKRVDRVIVATDSEMVREVVESAGGEVVLTSSAARTGSDRVAEVARQRSEPFFLNLQGDEPDVEPGDLDRLAEALRQGSHDEIVTLAQRIADPDEWNDPNVVKVVMDSNGRALYFSRAPIPHAKRKVVGGGLAGWKHVGVYGFARERLLEFTAMARSFLEEREGLEQLRALENSWPIRVIESAGCTRGINSREDYDRFVEAMGRGAASTADRRSDA